MSGRRTDDVIDALVDGLTPRPPLRHPLVRTSLWLACGSAFVLAIAASVGFRDDLIAHLADPRGAVEWLATLATAIASAAAAFHLALPDRDARWALLPLGPVAVWLTTLGTGCVGDWLARGAAGIAVGASPHCLKFIALTSIPLAAVLAVMVRHAASARPTATAANAALASAALSAAGLTLFHDLDSSIMVLVWHGAPTALVTMVGLLFGRPLLALLARIGNTR